MAGALVIVATPIGNLDDLSPRAIEAIASADVLACEDTRVTRKLLTRAPSTARLVAYHAHVGPGVASRILDQVADGKRVVLVSDAGTPGVSDPGQSLVAAARERGLPVEVIPGPSAALVALVASGFPSARFTVEGFLPTTGKARRRRLALLADETRTMVLFEAPHRLASMLTDLVATFGPDRRVALCRELTKRFEEVTVTSLADLSERLAETAPRGECTLVLEGTNEVVAEAGDDAVIEALRVARGDGASTRDAVAAVVEALGVPKRRVYDLAQALDNDDDA